MSRYASNSKVGSTKSRDEIERTLTRYGAESFMYGWEEDRAVVAFKWKTETSGLFCLCPIRMILSKPQLVDKEP